MKITWQTLAATALITATATPALAQNVDVRVKVALEGLGHLAWDTGDWQSSRYRATQTDRETRRFTIGTSGQLDLETMVGNITIRPSSGREVVVEIIKEASGVNDAAAKTGLSRVRIDSDERAGRVTIKTVYPNERQSNYRVSVDYIVSAPAGTRISTHSVSGDVTVEGINGELSLNTTSGNVTVTNAARLTSVKTVSGDLVLRSVGAEGLLDASTISGEILAAGVKARRLSLTTVSGSVTARDVIADDVTMQTMSDDVVFDGALTPRGRYEFTTHSGNVRLTLDGKTGFAFEGKTFSGSVRSDLQVQVSTVSNRRASTKTLTGTFGDGSAVVSATSFSGNVVITKK